MENTVDVKKLMISFGLAFLFLFTLLMVNQYLLLSGVFRENQPAIVQTLLLFLYSMPSAVTMGVPYAVCAGFTHGLIKNNFYEKFTHNQKSVIPVLVLALIIATAAFFFADFVLSHSNNHFRELFGTIIGNEEITGRSFRDMTSLEMIQTINEKTKNGLNKNDRIFNIYILELNKKFSIPFGALFFACFALSLSLVLGKHIKIAVCISLLACIAHWAILLYGQVFSSRMGRYGVLAMWLPNLLFLCVSAVLYFVACRRMKLN